MFRLTVTLASGESHSFIREDKPNLWRSWIMQQLQGKYSAAQLQGCSFKAERISSTTV